ncbi:MAG: histidine phosphatase family protein [Verrucomicrobia bacterium]|nr:histidine phosphatase family protein [Verrucomicrobiota bacterium]
MRVFLLRHAEAAPGIPDELRDLTPKGQRQVAELGKGTGRLALATVEAIEHSPLVRAVRTAQLLRLASGVSLPLQVMRGIKPEDNPRLTAVQLGKARQSRFIVGHNPHLAELAALLLGLGSGGEAIRFKKAGLLALERKERASAGHPYGEWSLLWMVVADFTK